MLKYDQVVAHKVVKSSSKKKDVATKQSVEVLLAKRADDGTLSWHERSLTLNGSLVSAFRIFLLFTRNTKRKYTTNSSNMHRVGF